MYLPASPSFNKNYWPNSPSFKKNPSRKKKSQNTLAILLESLRAEDTVVENESMLSESLSAGSSLPSVSEFSYVDPT